MKRTVLSMGVDRITVIVYDDGTGVIKSSLAEDGESAWNDAVDGLESLILAQACAGIDISTPTYLKAVETALEAISNNVG